MWIVHTYSGYMMPFLVNRSIAFVVEDDWNHEIEENNCHNQLCSCVYNTHTKTISRMHFLILWPVVSSQILSRRLMIELLGKSLPFVQICSFREAFVVHCTDRGKDWPLLFIMDKWKKRDVKPFNLLADCLPAIISWNWKCFDQMGGRNCTENTTKKRNQQHVKSIWNRKKFFFLLKNGRTGLSGMNAR